jgi:O-antigen/teichoic acid export membrane protein
MYFVIVSKYILTNLTPAFNLKILKGMLSYSLPLAFASISGVVISVADRYMLRYLSTLANVGIYSLGYKIANTLYVFVVMSINLAISPLVYKVMDQLNNKRIYSKVMTYAGLGVMTCVIGVSFFGREAIKVLAVNPDYWSSYQVIPFIAFGIFFGMLRDVSMIGLNLTKKTKIISTIIVSISLFNIGLNALFIPQWQMIGASAAALVSQLVFFVLIYIFAQKQYFIPYEVRKIVLMTVVGMLLVIGGSLVQTAPLGIRLGAKTIMFLSFPVILFYGDFFEAIELQRLHDAWLKWNDPSHWRRNISDFLKTST